MSTFFLAFILGVVVWVSAVVTTDPNEEGAFGPLPIDLRGMEDDMLLVNDIPSEANITLEAPTSMWEW